MYAGIPLNSADDSPLPASLSTLHFPTERIRTRAFCDGGCKTFHNYHGVLAFIIGMLIACCAWIANQGWIILDLLMFGDFSWTPTAWKHILLLSVGSLSTTFAFTALFSLILSNILNKTDDNDDNKEVDGGLATCKQGVSDALHDLGELGMMTGYFSSTLLFQTLVTKKFVVCGILFDESTVAIDNATIIFVLMWVLNTKMRDYNNAVERASNSHRSQEVFEGVQYWSA